MSETPIGEELTRMIMRHHPTAFEGDPEAIGAAVGAIATVLGGLLAFAYVKGGEGTWRHAFAYTVSLIQENQEKVIQNAALTAADQPSGLRGKN